MPDIKDSVVRMLEWKEAHPSTEFDLDPKWFVARVPGHDPIGAVSLGRLMDKLEMLDAADELAQPGG